MKTAEPLQESEADVAALRSSDPIADPDLAAAVERFRERMADVWTVASLGRAAGMSRTVFAARFTATVGEPPLHYVTRLRMRRAAALLTESRTAVKRIARDVGYESEAAFSHAFKRWSGLAPGGYRKRRQRAMCA